MATRSANGVATYAAVSLLDPPGFLQKQNVKGMIHKLCHHLSSHSRTKIYAKKHHDSSSITV